MIDISALYCGLETPGTPHRYGRHLTQLRVPKHQQMALARSANERRPVVVWNITRTCNLRCVHCYSDSACVPYDNELATGEALGVIDDLAELRVPAILWSGGEPLMRGDLFELAAHARQRGIHTVLSTNGTLITQSVAEQIKQARFAYVGVSLDGATAAVHDRFRGVPGAFDRTMDGFRNLVAVGQKVGLRLTLTRQTCEDLPRVFDLIEAEGIHRACFYHLVPTGRGGGVADLDLAQSRRAVDTIIERTAAVNRDGRGVEILTVDNHCDGPYLYLKMLAEDHPRAQQVYEMLRWNGGALWSTGVGIADIDSGGNVHPNQFWMHHTLGNVRHRPFSAIWTDTSDDLLVGLRDRRPRLKGRCAACRFVDLCGGSLRVRADLLTGDPWAPDPACYLSDEEIGLGAPAS